MKSQNGLDTSCAQVNRLHGGRKCTVEYDELLCSEVGCIVKAPLWKWKSFLMVSIEKKMCAICTKKCSKFPTLNYKITPFFACSKAAAVLTTAFSISKSTSWRDAVAVCSLMDTPTQVWLCDLANSVIHQRHVRWPPAYHALVLASLNTNNLTWRQGEVSFTM